MTGNPLNTTTLYTCDPVGVIGDPVLLLKVRASVLAAETRALATPRPAWLVGLFTARTKSVVWSPVTVNVCSAVVFAATAEGLAVVKKLTTSPIGCPCTGPWEGPAFWGTGVAP